MKFGVYAGVSFVIAVFTVFHAWSTRVQYYPMVMFLTTNKLSQVVLGNWCLVLTLAFGKLIRGIFLGPLRDIELEVMFENARYAITETCLALTVFRSDITAVTIAFFIALLFVKAFHWLAQARVEHLEQAGTGSPTSMARLASLAFLNLVVDMWMVDFCIELITFDKPSVNILFAFEFAILSVAAFATVMKLFLHVIDSTVPGAWHGKTTWVMLLEFFSEVFRFTFFLLFFMVMFTIYSVPPLHLVRDIYLSFSQIQRRLHAFYRYRQLASNMDQRFPNATEEELAECEHTCIICRDAMSSGKKLPCSHIFHVQCLRLWLQQQQACPTCRANIPTEDEDNRRNSRVQVAEGRQVEPGEPAAPVAPAGEGGVGVPAAAGNGAAQAAVPERGAGPGRTARAAPGPTASVGAQGLGTEMPRAADGVSRGRTGFGRSGSRAEGAAGMGRMADMDRLRTGFSGLRWDTLRARDGGMSSLGTMLQAVVVTAPGGAAVRKHVEPDSPVAREEPAEAILLLMGPPALCGSFCVYGGWVGGPGHENDVRLVEVGERQSAKAGAQAQPQQQPFAGAANFSWVPSAPPGANDAQAREEEKKSQSDAQGSGGFVQMREEPNATRGVEGGNGGATGASASGLRHRLVAGPENGGVDDGGQS